MNPQPTITVDVLKRVLDQSASALSAGRSNDQRLTIEAATPEARKERGAGMTLRQGVAEGPLGPILLVWNDSGLAGLAFLKTIDRASALADVAGPWSRARMIADDPGAVGMIDRIFAPLEGRPGEPMRLLVAGTDFQVRVWEALLRIPLGALVTYEALGQAVGKPGAARAVGNAVGANPVSWLIPCHRVIRQTAVIGHYRWGSEMKRLLIGAEASVVAPA